jgi:heat shock protein HslJ
MKATQADQAANGQDTERSSWINRGLRVLCASVLLVAAACSEEPVREQPGPQPQPAPEAEVSREPEPTLLNGTHWKLVEIRDVEGATVEPEDPEKYTFSFRDDGTLAMKLNCNRASAPWEADPVDEGRGRLAIGTPVMTRAFCPPPSLDEQIGSIVETMVSYAMDGNRLHVGLAGGAALILEPAEAPDQEEE